MNHIEDRNTTQTFKMPELPEVENFRRLLLPLVSREHPLVLERCSMEKAPPRKFISDDEMSDIQNNKMVVSDVMRKGKLICMILKEKKKTKGKTEKENCDTKYLFLHMGMTGRISTPLCIPKLKELSDTEIYPPPYTYLRLSVGLNQACFSDPRKFGAVYVKDVSKDFDVLAPDAWTSTRTGPIKTKMTSLEKGNQQEAPDDSTITNILAKLSEQSMSIKGVLLNQKRAVCGVGNWVADEVLYQTKMHPDQNYLTTGEAKILLERLHIILNTAVQCLYNDQEFPMEWLFHYRWSKRESKKTTVKDAHGRNIVFITSGGRTSAVVPSIQKKKSRRPVTIMPRREEKKTFKFVVKKKRAALKAVTELEAQPIETLPDTSSKRVKFTPKKGKTTTRRPTTSRKESGSQNGVTATRTADTVRVGRRRSSRLAKL